MFNKCQVILMAIYYLNLLSEILDTYYYTLIIKLKTCYLQFINRKTNSTTKPYYRAAVQKAEENK